VVKKKKRSAKKGSVDEDKKKLFYRASPKKMYGTYAYPSPREKSEEQPKRHNFKPEEPTKGAVISYRKK
jgi:hypothetical protein